MRKKKLSKLEKGVVSEMKIGDVGIIGADYYNMVEDEDGISYPNGLRGMFMSKELNFCGCISKEIEDDFLNILNLFLENENSIYYTKIAEELNLDKKYIELVLQYLDDKGFLEHGSALRGSWLSEEGKEKLTKKYSEVLS